MALGAAGVLWTTFVGNAILGDQTRYRGRNG